MLKLAGPKGAISRGVVSRQLISFQDMIRMLIRQDEGASQGPAWPKQQNP